MACRFDIGGMTEADEEEVPESALTTLCGVSGAAVEPGDGADANNFPLPQYFPRGCVRLAAVNWSCLRRSLAVCFGVGFFGYVFGLSPMAPCVSRSRSWRSMFAFTMSSLILSFSAALSSHACVSMSASRCFLAAVPKGAMETIEPTVATGELDTNMATDVESDTGMQQ